MSKGLILKSLRETMGFTIAFAVGLLGFHCLLAYIAPIIITELSGSFMKMVFIKNIMKGLLGSEMAQPATTAAVSAFAWIHPIPLILIWTQSIVFWSRMPAGEIENGTMDILLSQPVSRLQLILTETLVWIGCGVFLILAVLAGNRIGSSFIAAEHRMAAISLLKIAVNLFCLYIAVGGVASLCSAWRNRRFSAMGCAFAFVILSYLIHTLVPFWSAAKSISFLSIMDYYNPLAIVRNPAWPIANLSILAGLGATFWLAGLILFSRKNLHTT